jgi:hypothetical protein
VASIYHECVYFEMIENVRSTTNLVEFLWTACALVGLLIGLFMLRETWLGIRALRHFRVNGVRHREATRDLRTGLAFVLIFPHDVRHPTRNRAA